MPRNINQIFSDNPLTTIPQTALIYLGASGTDAAIQAASIFPASAVDGAITLFNGTSATRFKSSAVVINSQNNISGITTICTNPPAASTVTTAFGGTLGFNIPKQNTLGYDVQLNIAINMTIPGGEVPLALYVGIGTTSSPTAVSVLSMTGSQYYYISAYVPNNYYINVTTGPVILASGSIYVVAMGV